MAERSVVVAGGRSAPRTAEQWAELIAEQERSGRTQAEFCRLRGVSVHVLRQWKYRNLRRLRLGAVRHELSVPSFLPVEIVTDYRSASPLRGDVSEDLGFGSGVSVLVGQQRIVLDRDFDQGTLDRAVAVLQARRC